MSEAVLQKPGDASATLERNNLILVVLGTTLISLRGHFPEVWSFLAGGLLTVVNLRLLRLIVAGLVQGRVTHKGKLLAQVLIKFLGLMGALALLMLVLHPVPLAFLLGLSTIVLAIIFEGILGVFRRE